MTPGRLGSTRAAFLGTAVNVWCETENILERRRYGPPSPTPACRADTGGARRDAIDA
ncbi:hypothetical protein Shyhy01_15000 [Streptomyces hygroscopicus subsp. hygroscopicus]|nr:hypothetical protein Shyhy01_15000 [Streptomyces hygroscopicus subsp. hygroscopicus]